MSARSVFIRSVSVGVLVVATSTGAQALTVSRCNQLIDGVYKPVLVVEDNGNTVVHQIGDDGLSRRVLFDPKAALAWAVQKYGADAATSSNIGDCFLDGGGSSPGLITLPEDDDDDYGGYDDDDDYGGFLEVT